MLKYVAERRIQPKVSLDRFNKLPQHFFRSLITGLFSASSLHRINQNKIRQLISSFLRIGEKTSPPKGKFLKSYLFVENINIH